MSSKPDSPGETQQARTVATLATRWAQIEDDLIRPAEAKMLKRATDVSADRAAARGAASADFSRNFADTRRNVTESLTRRGNAVGSGRFNIALSDVSTDEGRATALGLNDVDAAVEDQAAVNRQAVIDQSMGKAASGAAGMGRAARLSTAQSIEDARSSAAARGNIASLAGAGAAIATHGAMKTGTPAVSLQDLDADAWVDEQIGALR